MTTHKSQILIAAVEIPVLECILAGYFVFPTELLAKSEPDEPPVALWLRCLAYAGVGATTWWLEQEQPCSPEQLVEWLGKISSAICRSLLPC